jgi:acetyl esterase/lipase
MMIAVRACLCLVLIATVSCPASLPADEPVAITPDVVYGHKYGMALTLDVFQPKEANGVGVLFMVSGGWNSIWQPPETSLRFFKPLLDHGFTVFAVRHGSSPKFTLPEIVPDVSRSVRFVRANAARWNVDPDRLGVCGGSAGGHLALMLGTTGEDGDPRAHDELERFSSRVSAVVAYFPPTDLRPYMAEGSHFRTDFPALQFEPERAGEYSPLLHVTADDAPSLMIHGDQDQLVTLDHSQKILAAFEEQKVPTRLVVIEGAGHGFTGEDAARAAGAWVGWFNERLVAASPGPDAGR